MQDINRDRLEEFFRKQTEKYYFEYNEADWKKLSARLDEEGLRGAAVPFWRNGAWRYFVFGGLALIAALLFFLKINNDLGVDLQPVDSKENLAGSSPHRYGAKKEAGENMSIYSESEVQSEPGKDSQHAPSNSSAGEVKKNIAPTTSSNQQTAATMHAGRSLKDENVEDTNAAPLSSNTPETMEKTEIKGATKTEIPPVSGNESESVIGFQDKETSAAFSSGVGRGRSTPYLLPFGLTIGEMKHETLPLVFAEREETENEPEDEMIKKDPRSRTLLTAGFTVAPDFSSVGLADHTRPGGRYGLVIDYYFTKKLAVHAGAIMANNIYTARGDQYHAPPGLWEDEEMPVSADGKCKILDIPLSLRYDALSFGKNTFFVSGGATSYIMLNEEYTFRFANSSIYQGRTSTYETKNSGNHFMGLINLSIGYEGFVADRWSLQVEPFANVPVTGIGMGKVDLYSLGMYFTLKYHWKKR